MNITVKELQRMNFRSLSLSEQIQIKENGRPTPRLTITQLQSGKNRADYYRKFDPVWYNKVSWLCGCEERNTLFCFPCLLFGGDNVWTVLGVCDLKNINDKYQKHERSAKHINNTVELYFLGKPIAMSVNSAGQKSVRFHNDVVDKNRSVLSKIIDVLKLSGACNLPFQDRSESDISSNGAAFSELLEYSKILDPLLFNHFENGRAFRGGGTLESVQCDLLDCILEVCQDFIRNEIRQSSFLALMVNDVTDISTSVQTALMFRYELNGRVYERFWGFLNTENYSADSLSICILKELQKVLQDCPKKLIAQTYDGANVYQGGENVSAAVHNVYPCAKVICSYAQPFNELLVKTSSHIASVAIFFRNVSGISDFFSTSSARTAALAGICDVRIPKLSDTGWNNLIQTVFQNKDSVGECFKNIVSGNSNSYDRETIYQAAGFNKWFADHSFQFWLKFFNSLMLNVEFVYSRLKFETDVVKIKEAIGDFEREKSTIMHDLPFEFAEIKEEPDVKRPRSESPDPSLNPVAWEICNAIVAEITDRFEFKSHFAGARLFSFRDFKHYQKRFPLGYINDFSFDMPMISKDMLKTELTVFYSRPEFSRVDIAGSCLKILNFLLSCGLDKTAFKEVTKALKVLVTLPMTGTSETDRCLWTVKKVKSFLRKSEGKNRVTALGMLSVEKTMVKEIPDFNRKVIDKFANLGNRWMDFQYR